MDLRETAPAQSAVEYEIRKFDLPAVPQGPFVGKGPEVDAMWDYITDSSMSTILYNILIRALLILH